VHRDLKPDNVFLVERAGNRDFVKILDFGIAKFGVGQNDLTHAGAVFGTPNYMAPEQALGKPTSPATDIYALGVICYEMASGEVPFRGDSPIAVLTRHATEAAEPLEARVPGVLPAFAALVARCLEKEPHARFANMRLLIEELDALSATGPLPEVAETPAPPSLSPLSRGGRGTPASPVTVEKKSNPGLALWVLLGLAGAAYGGFKLREAKQQPREVVTVTVPAPAAPAPVGAAARETDKNPEKTRDVALVLFPLDAHVVVGDRDLGAMPVTVKVPEGHTVSAEVRRDGYWTRRLRLDGSKSRIVVGLVKRENGASAAPSSGPPAAEDSRDEPHDDSP